MFDSVSSRYDLLNRLMTLGRDRAWRASMANAVPAGAGVVLDLCTGNGVSLPALRRPGRVVLGIDVSLAMLEDAHARFSGAGWAPRLAAADAFRLPLRASSIDALTVAFGIRNLRPRPDALREIARVLRDGGTLAVLEAAAPRPGWFAPFHALHLRYVVPLAGRLSPDPSAYRYLSQSIFDFGSGEEFERDLSDAGFELERHRSFLLGASRLWVARRSGPRIEDEPGSAGSVHHGADLKGADAAAAANGSALRNARRGGSRARELPQPTTARDREWRVWTTAQLVTSVILLLALIYGLWTYRGLSGDLSLPPWQRRGFMALIVGGIVVFAARSLMLALRLTGPPGR
ncbi:MAG TPA: ubiquinone/menaquinone biosynthesis methyltransferase [Candidatus Udaeobacter sp.]|nr:ubiquinone/menaquinone biosynthesis methyltransferase [Candidatus Udaeobacter sp.]